MIIIYNCILNSLIIYCKRICHNGIDGMLCLLQCSHHTRTEEKIKKLLKAIIVCLRVYNRDVYGAFTVSYLDTPSLAMHEHNWVQP